MRSNQQHPLGRLEQAIKPKSLAFFLFDDSNLRDDGEDTGGRALLVLRAGRPVTRITAILRTKWSAVDAGGRFDHTGGGSWPASKIVPVTATALRVRTT